MAKYEASKRWIVRVDLKVSGSNSKQATYVCVHAHTAIVDNFCINNKKKLKLLLNIVDKFFTFIVKLLLEYIDSERNIIALEATSSKQLLLNFLKKRVI